MVTASFLTKHLLVDWRWGERYFRQKLIDGDLAANNGGWQWSAGTGCDAQPYFRVFHPISQCEKFDPTGAYIRTYLPEREQVDLKLIHKFKIPTQAQLFVETDYASPIVDHKFARMRAIDVLSAMKKGSVNAQQVRSDSSVDLDKEIFG
jgi:deoxyribodipyrimidine photo-lyase